ncbi:MAG: hypothetical protein KJN60_14080 [Boseongicola sp.]|nr:hypothetical protein [Boseongicola sp.]
MRDTSGETEMTFCAHNWFVAQLKPNGLSMAQRNLERQAFAHFSPQRLETVRRSNGAKTAPRPLLPGYPFVQFDPKQAGWTAINATRGIAPGQL